jgi:hypothetical protein
MPRRCDRDAGSADWFAQTPIGQVWQYSKGVALMLESFERAGYNADIAGLEREFGRRLTKNPEGRAATWDEMDAKTTEPSLILRYTV